MFAKQRKQLFIQKHHKWPGENIAGAQLARFLNEGTGYRLSFFHHVARNPKCRNPTRSLERSSRRCSDPISLSEKLATDHLANAHAPSVSSVIHMAEYLHSSGFLLLHVRLEAVAVYVELSTYTRLRGGHAGENMHETTRHLLKPVSTCLHFVNHRAAMMCVCVCVYECYFTCAQPPSRVFIMAALDLYFFFCYADFIVIDS